MTKQKQAICAFCKKTFFRPINRFDEAKRHGWKQFCSKKCLISDRKTGRIISCGYCGKKFYRALNDISLYNYCSRSCAASANNRKSPKRKPKIKVCTRCDKSFLSGTGNLKFCSMKCRGATRPGYTKKDILRIIKHKVAASGRVPARRELEGINKACERLFGSWNNAIIAAGLHPNRSHNKRMYSIKRRKVKDGHLCDSISETIIDDWFFKHKIKHRINVKYPTTGHKADWAIILNNKMFFVEYFGLANDSPRYDREIINKRNLCKKNLIPLIEFYALDLYPKNRLEQKLNCFIRAGGY